MKHTAYDFFHRWDKPSFLVSLRIGDDPVTFGLLKRGDDLLTVFLDEGYCGFSVIGIDVYDALRGSPYVFSDYYARLGHRAADVYKDDVSVDLEYIVESARSYVHEIVERFALRQERAIGSQSIA